jgi:PKHD-type hydroxylase
MPPQTSSAGQGGRDPGASTCSADVFPRPAIDYLNRLAEASAGQAEAGGIVRADATPALADTVRRSEVVWLQDTPDNRPIYEVIAQFAQQANNQVFRLELTGFTEPFQLATYRASEGGFYGWHVDIGAGRLANRKLSLIVPLTDPAEYEGGEFQVFYDHEPTTFALPLGRILAFPSYLLHRVTPVTKGVRRSLAIWVSGPPFR